MRIFSTVFTAILLSSCTFSNSKDLQLGYADTIYTELCLTYGNHLLTIDVDEVIRIRTFNDQGSALMAEIPTDSIEMYCEMKTKESLTNEEFWRLKDYIPEMESGSLRHAIFSGRKVLEVKRFIVDRFKNIVLEVEFSFVARRPKGNGEWQGLLYKKTLNLQFNTDPLVCIGAYDIMNDSNINRGGYEFIPLEIIETKDGYTVFSRFGNFLQNIATVGLNHSLETMNSQTFALNAWEMDFDTTKAYSKHFRFCQLHSDLFASIQRGKVMIHKQISSEGLILDKREKHPARNFYLTYPVDIAAVNRGFLSIWKQNDNSYFPERYTLKWHRQDSEGNWMLSVMESRIESSSRPSILATDGRVYAIVQEDDFYRFVPLNIE